MCVQMCVTMALMVNYIIIVGVYVYMCECVTDACTACNKLLGLLSVSHNIVSCPLLHQMHCSHCTPCMHACGDECYNHYIQELLLHLL